MKHLNFTEEQQAYITKHWGPISNIPDDKAKEIVEELLDIEVGYASFSDDTSIYYELSEDDEHEDDVERGWNEQYLNSIGMSLKDF